MPRIFIAMPQYRPMDKTRELELADLFGLDNWKPMGLHPQVGASILDVKLSGYDCLLHIMRFDGLIERSQCTLFGQWLYEWNKGNKFEYYLRLDEDIEFSPSTIQSMIDADKPIIGGAYAYKADKGPLCKKSVCKYLVGEIPDKNGILKILWLNGGFQFFRYDALLKLATGYPELRYDRKPQGEHDEVLESYALWTTMIKKVDTGLTLLLSEDYAICQRAIDIGMEVYLDTKVDLCHWDGATGYLIGRDPVKVTKEYPPWEKKSLTEITSSVA